MTMSKNTSCNKQHIVDHGSNDASDNVAIMVIVDENKHNASNENTNAGNAFLLHSLSLKSCTSWSSLFNYVMLMKKGTTMPLSLRWWVGTKM